MAAVFLMTEEKSTYHSIQKVKTFTPPSKEYPLGDTRHNAVARLSSRRHLTRCLAQGLSQMV